MAHNFKPGDVVRCIAKDGYMENIFVIGKTFEVAQTDPSCLVFVDTIGGPYAWKFELVEQEPTKLSDHEYLDVLAAQEAMERVAE